MEVDFTTAIPTERSEDLLRDRKEEFRKLCLKVKGKVGKMHYYVNPLSTLIGALVLWAIIVWAIVDNDNSIVDLNEARRWITDKCTWFYIGSQFLWPILLVVIYFKFGHIKLGLTDSMQEYTNFEFFSMVFTTGISTGFYFDGVNYPIASYNGPNENLLLYRGKDNYVAKAINALNVVVYHYGFHGLGVFLPPSLLMSVLAYRKGLPLTMRSCFYPVFGRKIFGRLGDLVDAVSIICIAIGVSTSFMLGALLIVSGIKVHFPDQIESNQSTKIISLWCVCLCGFLSAATGIRLGIRRISQLCFLTSAFFTVTVALSDNIWYLLNLIIQALGHYAQFIIGTGTFTGALIQEGNYPGAIEHDIKWMNENTIFYWGWWLGWAPLVSIFITRISKGRTIKNTLLYGYFIPCLMSFLWFVIIGGVVIDTENRALALNVTCNSSLHPVGIPKWIQRFDCIEQKEERLYSILEKYEDTNSFLQVVALVITIFYFVTSMDSAALVMGSISSNGQEDPPLIQRAFWCVTLGAVTNVLILYQHSVGEASVGAFAVLAGVPFAIIECLCAVALWRVLRDEPNWSYEYLIKWKMLYANINSTQLLKDCLIATVAPWYHLGEVYIKEKNASNKKASRILSYMVFAIPFYLWILLLFLRLGYVNVDNIGWSSFISFLLFSGLLRRKVRERYGIQGNILEDITVMILFPLTSVQMYVQCQESPATFQKDSTERRDTVIPNSGVSESNGYVDMVNFEHHGNHHTDRDKKTQFQNLEDVAAF